MRAILPAIVIVAASLAVQADTTGRISGKVINKKGEALPAAVVILKRIDITWVKEVKPNANGTFLQVGLEPKEFELRVKCPGYSDFVEQVKIPLGETLQKNITLLTAEEAKAVAATTAKEAITDPGQKAENEGTDAFNKAVGLYNDKNYKEAQPLLETAQAKFQESIKLTKEEEPKVGLNATLVKIDRVLGLVLAENFIANPSATELAARSQPLLEKALERKADDGPAIQTLLNLAKAKKDKELEKKYQEALDKLIGPRPELAYNEAVAAFNAGDMKKAKVNLQKAIETDPKFPESYYLMGMVEYSLNNLKGTKEAFLKYLEIAPAGKKAGEVKEMLADPSLKRIK